MPDSSDTTDPALPLTRRELRERERRAAAEAEPVDVPAGIVPSADAELTAATESVIVNELAEPSLVVAIVTESDRVIAAPAADEERESHTSLLLSDAPTSTMSIPIPTRSQLRRDAEARTAGPKRARTEVAASAESGAATGAFAPRGRFVPATTPPRIAPRAQPVSDRMRKFATTSMTVAAMGFVALMAVSTSLPAQALLSTAEVRASAQAASRPSMEGVQTLDIAGGDTITVERDGYSSSTIAEVAAASGIRMEATFTNNPNGTIQWPFAVGVHIGDQKGPRNCAGCSANHGGQDFNPGVGAPIQAIADGVVSLAQDGEGSLGVHMVIDHMIDGKLVSSVYAHMIHGSMNFQKGDVVKVGQVIGKTGSTGMSTGPHLHFEIREGGKGGTKVDPLKWLYAHTN
ncbi:peptidoglycan DD-metalloendopeptidase family protein [Cryobacterium psychrophilum]|uniref:peptidoglycan DD-metalloendopeptidase family protein n=1 Tax=Cryobacterium psychrophilum TaxID=41988 RepID=UPI00141709A9|nr:peptidoglycan DD-metalloendopeptidase family protein [Cryobacterium psychrophilum]